MIDYKLQTEIEQILAKYRHLSPIEIANKLGIEILFVDGEPGFAGALKKFKDPERIVIFVNKNDDEKRQLFTIAHELGHFFIHTDDIDAGIVSYRNAKFYENYTIEERKREEQANHFAGELLMPRKEFLFYYNKHRNEGVEKTIETIAEKFYVSKDAARIRMSYLDLN